MLNTLLYLQVNTAATAPSALLSLSAPSSVLSFFSSAKSPSPPPPVDAARGSSDGGGSIEGDGAGGGGGEGGDDAGGQVRVCTAEGGDADGTEGTRAKQEIVPLLSVEEQQRQHAQQQLERQRRHQQTLQVNFSQINISLLLDLRVNGRWH